MGVNDIYGNAVIDYILYKSYVKDAENAGNSQRATGHYNLFLSAIGQKTQLDTVDSPSGNKQVG